VSKLEDKFLRAADRASKAGSFLLNCLDEQMRAIAAPQENDLREFERLLTKIEHSKGIDRG